ncbi:hypothetical protein TNCV_3352151 [Trichonephila clavipes]|nr:hypothetical protein TNCV_3352151 [Trichonephila clavipes]
MWDSKVGIHLGCNMRQCSLTFWSEYHLQHPSLTVLQLRLSLTVVLHRSHPALVCVGCITPDTVVIETFTRFAVLDMDDPAI